VKEDRRGCLVAETGDRDEGVLCGVEAEHVTPLSVSEIDDLRPGVRIESASLAIA
jgi:hypothetical protein